MEGDLSRPTDRDLRYINGQRFIEILLCLPFLAYLKTSVRETIMHPIYVGGKKMFYSLDLLILKLDLGHMTMQAVFHPASSLILHLTAQMEQMKPVVVSESPD